MKKINTGVRRTVDWKVGAFETSIAYT